MNCYVSFSGRLGNKLFQLAAAYAYAMDHDKKLFIVDKKLPKIFEKFDRIDPPIDSSVTRFNPKIKNGELYSPFIEGDVQITPYCHSLKFFEKYKEDFINKLILPNVQYNIDPDDIAFHIRLGDYLKFQHRFGNVVKYFHTLFDVYKDRNITVSTDSPDIVAKEYSKYKFKLLPKDFSAEECLVILSKHSNIVCSNSTFSWWASILGEEKHITIFPDIWFFDHHTKLPIYLKDIHTYYEGITTYPML